MAYLNPSSLDIFRDKFKFLLKNNKLLEALQHAEKMAMLFEAFQTESSMCKAMLSTTIILLSLGDIVKAEQIYLQEHLNNSTYLNSKECKLADEFILAFKNYDIELLEKTQASPSLNYIEREIQDLARKLSLLSVKTEGERSLNKISKEMSKMMSSGVPLVSSKDEAFDEFGNLIESPRKGDADSGNIGKAEYYDTGDDEIDLT